MTHLRAIKAFITKIIFFQILALTIFCSGFSAEDFKIPALRAPVTDSAGMVSRPVLQILNRALQDLHRQGGSQLSILTVDHLAGLTIEDASIRVTDQWKLGGAKDDRGLLLLIAKKERQIRIEVGQGLEGELTDAHSKRIIDEGITPLFKSGNIDAGLVVGVSQILSRTDPNFDISSYFGSQNFKMVPKRKKGLGVLEIVFGILFFILVISSRGGFLGFLLGASLGRGLRGGSGFGGGFGGRGGGSWSGGGGGFSGGGASGSW